jgi:hypothetical protein
MNNREGKPHATRGDKYPNLSGDPNAAPRCGARTRHGGPCRQPAMRNGRCRLHGGRSTGPKTAAGRERIRAAATRHGNYGAEAQATRALIRELLARAKATGQSV